MARKRLSNSALGNLTIHYDVPMFLKKIIDQKTAAERGRNYVCTVETESQKDSTYSDADKLKFQRTLINNNKNPKITATVTTTPKKDKMLGIVFIDTLTDNKINGYSVDAVRKIVETALVQTYGGKYGIGQGPAAVKQSEKPTDEAEPKNDKVEEKKSSKAKPVFLSESKVGSVAVFLDPPKNMYDKVNLALDKYKKDNVSLLACVFGERSQRETLAKAIPSNFYYVPYDDPKVASIVVMFERGTGTHEEAQAILQKGLQKALGGKWSFEPEQTEEKPEAKESAVKPPLGKHVFSPKNVFPDTNKDKPAEKTVTEPKPAAKPANSHGTFTTDLGTATLYFKVPEAYTKFVKAAQKEFPKMKVLGVVESAPQKNMDAAAFKYTANTIEEMSVTGLMVVPFANREKRFTMVILYNAKVDEAKAKSLTVSAVKYAFKAKEDDAEEEEDDLPASGNKAGRFSGKISGKPAGKPPTKVIPKAAKKQVEEDVTEEDDSDVDDLPASGGGSKGRFSEGLTRRSRGGDSKPAEKPASKAVEPVRKGNTNSKKNDPYKAAVDEVVTNVTKLLADFAELEQSSKSNRMFAKVCDAIEEELKKAERSIYQTVK